MDKGKGNHLVGLFLVADKWSRLIGERHNKIPQGGLDYFFTQLFLGSWKLKDEAGLNQFLEPRSTISISPGKTVILRPLSHSTLMSWRSRL